MTPAPGSAHAQTHMSDDFLQTQQTSLKNWEEVRMAVQKRILFGDEGYE